MNKEQIANALLRQAGYYWDKENEDTVNPIDPDTYDPAVDKIFKANAVELEKLYAEIGVSQQRVITGLSRTLVPDSSLLPFPAVTVAQLDTKFARIEITPEDSFMISGQDDTGDKHDYYFTTLFEHQFPSCQLKYIITNSDAIRVETDKLQAIEDKNAPAGFKDTKHIWIGLDINKSTDPDDHLIFFLGNKIVNEFDRHYAVFCSTEGKHRSTWKINGKDDLELQVHKGLEHFLDDAAKAKPKDATSNLLNALKIPYAYEQQVFTRFKGSFLTLKNLPDNLEIYKSPLPPFGEDTHFEIPQKEPLLWIRLDFQLPIPNKFFLKNRLYVNCVPVLNRKLIQRNVSKSDFDRILLPMPTQDYFLSVNKIWDETEETGYERVDILNPDDQHGSYIVRTGDSVRRFNKHDASKQIYRLLETIQEEHTSFKEGGINRLKEDFDVIDKAMNRIRKEMYDDYYQKGLRTDYFAVANFRSTALAIYYNYWESQGDALNHFRDRNDLEVRSVDVRGIKGKTIIPIQEGRGELREEDYINLLKEAILSRNKIITKGDIEQYFHRYKDSIEVVNISRELSINQQTQEYERVILVRLKLIRKTKKDNEVKEFMTARLQNELNAMTTFFTPIKIEFFNG